MHVCDVDLNCRLVRKHQGAESEKKKSIIIWNVFQKFFLKFGDVSFLFKLSIILLCIVFNVHGISMDFRRIIESFRKFQNFLDWGTLKSL